MSYINTQEELNILVDSCNILEPKTTPVALGYIVKLNDEDLEGFNKKFTTNYKELTIDFKPETSGLFPGAYSMFFMEYLNTFYDQINQDFTKKIGMEIIDWNELSHPQKKIIAQNLGYKVNNHVEPYITLIFSIIEKYLILEDDFKAFAKNIILDEDRYTEQSTMIFDIKEKIFMSNGIVIEFTRHRKIDTTTYEYGEYYFVDGEFLPNR